MPNPDFSPIAVEFWLDSGLIAVKIREQLAPTEDDCQRGHHWRSHHGRIPTAIASKSGHDPVELWVARIQPLSAPAKDDTCAQGGGADGARAEFCAREITIYSHSANPMANRMRSWCAMNGESRIAQGYAFLITQLKGLVLSWMKNYSSNLISLIMTLK